MTRRASVATCPVWSLSRGRSLRRHSRTPVASVLRRQMQCFPQRQSPLRKPDRRSDAWQARSGASQNWAFGLIRAQFSTSCRNRIVCHTDAVAAIIPVQLFWPSHGSSAYPGRRDALACDQRCRVFAPSLYRAHTLGFYYIYDVADGPAAANGRVALTPRWPACLQSQMQAAPGRMVAMEPSALAMFWGAAVAVSAARTLGAG